MKVTLMVNWRERQILTVKELDECVDARVEDVIRCTNEYEEYLDEYLDSNYTKMELFEALSNGNTEEREEVIANIRSGVAEAIHDYVNMDISSDFSEVEIEV